MAEPEMAELLLDQDDDDLVDATLVDASQSREMPSILAIDPDSALWDVQWPFDELTRQGFPATHWRSSDLLAALGQECDLVLASWRNALWASAEARVSTVQALHNDGKLVTLDVDDDLFSLAVGTPWRLRKSFVQALLHSSAQRRAVQRAWLTRLCPATTASTTARAAALWQGFGGSTATPFRIA